MIFLFIFAIWQKKNGCRRELIVFFMKNCELEEKVSQSIPLTTTITADWIIMQKKLALIINN